MSSSTKDAVWDPLRTSGAAAVPTPPGSEVQIHQQGKDGGTELKVGESEPWGTKGFTADTELNASTHLLLSFTLHYGVVMTARAVIPHSFLCLVPRAWLLVGWRDVLCVHLSFLVYFF